jgi:hypothetical protein
VSVILSDPKLFVVLVVLSVPAYVLIWRTFFGGWDDFTEALYYLVSPRWLAWLRGELVEDSWAHVQLLFFAGLSLAERSSLRPGSTATARVRGLTSAGRRTRQAPLRDRGWPPSPSGIRRSSS